MEYELIRSSRKTIAAEIRNGRLIIRAPMRASRREIDAFVQRHRRWIESHLAAAQEAASARRLTDAELRELTEQAKAVIPERAAHYAPLVGVRYGSLTVRHQKTRWGSCSSRGDLSFNCLLMLAPPEVLDSVVVHELCHIKEMNHSDRFYAELLRVFPDYPACRKWLREHGAALLAMLGE